MSQQFSTRTPSEYHSFGVPRSDRRPQHQVPAPGRPQERTWTALDDPRDSHGLGHPGGHRDGHRRPSGTVAAQHERSGMAQRRRDPEFPPRMPKTHGDGEGHKWFPKFRGGAKEREREKEKEVKTRTFDKSAISQPLPPTSAMSAYLRDTKESQRRLHEPMLAEMGLAHAMDRPPMKLRPIERAGAPELPAELESLVQKERMIRRRPVPVPASRPRPRDSGDSLARLSMLSMTAVINEPNGVINPRWVPRPIDAMTFGYTGSSESLDSTSSVSPDSSASVSRPSSPEPTDVEEFVTSRRSKRLGRIFTPADLTTFPEFPEEPAPVADDEEDNDDGEKPHEDAASHVTESDFSSVTESVTSDESSGCETDIGIYDYLSEEDQGVRGVVLSGSRYRPPINVIPPTPTSSLPPSPPPPPSPSPSPSPSLSPSLPPAREQPVANREHWRGAAAMDPYRLRVERAWKRAAEQERTLRFRERDRLIRAEEHAVKFERLAIPLLAAHNDIVECSDEFRGVRYATDVPPIVRKILEERDEALDEADAHVRRALGLENQLHGAVAELQELRAQMEILWVDNTRLRNGREGLPLETGVRGPAVAGHY
ncbi:hypothetical protein PG988_012962 [Apiospora saccharicola]